MASRGTSPAQSKSWVASTVCRVATSDSARLLQDVPGLSLYTAGGVSSLPAIRGLADDRLHRLLARLRCQLLKALERRPGGIRMDRAKAARMACGCRSMS